MIADEGAPVGLLFGATSEGSAVTQATRRIAIAAIGVSGVPQIAIDEALWMTAATLERPKGPQALNEVTASRSPAVFYTRFGLCRICFIEIAGLSLFQAEASFWLARS